MERFGSERIRISSGCVLLVCTVCILQTRTHRKGCMALMYSINAINAKNEST